MKLLSMHQGMIYGTHHLTYGTPSSVCPSGGPSAGSAPTRGALFPEGVPVLRQINTKIHIYTTILLLFTRLWLWFPSTLFTQHIHILQGYGYTFLPQTYNFPKVMVTLNGNANAVHFAYDSWYGSGNGHTNLNQYAPMARLWLCHASVVMVMPCLCGYGYVFPLATLW